MNALLGLGILAGIIYGIFIDGTYFKLYFGLVLIYHILTQYVLINRKELTKRKGILVTSWDGNVVSNSDMYYRTRGSSFLHSY